MTRLLPIPKQWQDVIALDPTSELAIKYAKVQRRIDAHNAEEQKHIAVQQRSRIGTWMKSKIEASVGGIPCGGCKQTLISLNRMTADDVRGNRAGIINQISKNSKKSTMAWWARVLTLADDVTTDGSVARLMIGRWLDEACDAEDANPLVIDSNPDNLDPLATR